MKQKIIWVNTIVNNEENFIWFAMMSVLDYVDKVLIYDTGSTDKTVDVIKELIKLKGEKIKFKQVGPQDKFQFTAMRQKMLEESKCDWILILDGDEVWWEDSIKRVFKTINEKGDEIDAIVVPFYNSVGDIYHYQSKDAGKYKILGTTGHLTIRAIKRNIPGLHLGGPYGAEGYLDGKNISIQDEYHHKLFYLNRPFMHLTHLKRSSKDTHGKYKFDLGIKFPQDFNLPEIFYQKPSEIVPSPFKKRSMLFEIISFIRAPYTFLWRKMK